MQKKLNLPSDELAIVKSILAQYVPNMIVWAYGSRVTGKSHEGSDLDLVIINPHDAAIKQSNLAALRAAFSESDLTISIDVMDWALIPAHFKDEINKSHIVIASPG